MRAGDCIIYRLTKYSSSPGRRARNVHPERKGECYTYQVDKFWVVDKVNADGTLQVATRRGKRRVLDSDDSMLRKANWWERIVHSRRFPKLA